MVLQQAFCVQLVKTTHCPALLPCIHFMDIIIFSTWVNLLIHPVVEDQCLSSFESTAAVAFALGI